ncbi:MAG: hypothetical protein AAF998_01775 [Bacteroidota bacterium]
MDAPTSSQIYPETVPGVRLQREEGAWKYIDLGSSLGDATLQELLRTLPTELELCFFDYRFGDRIGDMNGLYVMLQVFEGQCYFWRGNHGRTSPLETKSIPEAAQMIQTNIVQEDAFLYLVPAARRFETRPDFRWKDAPERAPDGQGELLRHLLSAIAYRFRTAVRGMGRDFGDFADGPAVRTPRETVHFMRRQLHFVEAQFRTETAPEIEARSWTEEVKAFPAVLQRLDEALLHHSPNEILFKKLLQGPLSEIQVQIGQLLLLRRAFGYPVIERNLFNAEIRTGNTRGELF